MAFRTPEVSVSSFNSLKIKVDQPEKGKIFEVKSIESALSTVIRKIKQSDNQPGKKKPNVQRTQTNINNKTNTSTADRGKLLATLIGRKILMQSAMKQRQELSKKAVAQKGILKDLGYDFKEKKYIRNSPVKLRLEPDRKTLMKTSKHATERQQ